MTLRMKIKDLFRIGDKTVFTGELTTRASSIADIRCMLEVDGEPAGEVYIEGEVHTGQPQRDLWTTSPVTLSREIVQFRDVWLIAI